jgi:hypothetical protein
MVADSETGLPRLAVDDTLPYHLLTSERGLSVIDSMTMSAPMPEKTLVVLNQPKGSEKGAEQ